MGKVKKLHFYMDGLIQSTLKQLFATVENIQVVWHTTGRLWSSSSLTQAFVKNWFWQENSSPIIIATTERAILETLEMIPAELGFEHAEQIFQGLTQLSPKNLNVVLKGCKSIKTKRLFFWFADRYDYPWRKYLNHKDFDLGSGKRKLCKNGTLDSKYLITVPSDLLKGDAYV